MRQTRLLFETSIGAPAQGLAAKDVGSGHIQVLAGPASWYFGFSCASSDRATARNGRGYEVTKFVRGVVDGAPELLQALWSEPAAHIAVDPLFLPFIENRQAFLSARAAQRFLSQSWALWQTLCERRSWLAACPLLPVTRQEYEIDHPAPASFAGRLLHQQNYEAARRSFNRCEAWQDSRNPHQARLEARTGYDGHLAMHALRLARMAHEMAVGGNVVVRRHDCSDLVAIRDGGSSFDALVQQLHSVRQATTHALATGNLRSEPDVSLASELLTRLLTAHLVTQSEDDEYPLN